MTSLDHLDEKLRGVPLYPSEFVLHSLRHTMLTRLGEAGAGPSTIMRIAGHSSVTVSQRHVHSLPEALERAFERLEAINEKKNPSLHERHKPSLLPTIFTTAQEVAPVIHLGPIAQLVRAADS